MKNAAVASAESDRRAHPRFATSRNARLLFALSPSLDCTILDISQGGARVELKKAGHVPQQGVLIDFVSGVAHQSAVVWSKRQEMGLKFLRSQALGGLVPAEFQEAKRHWLAG